VAQDDSTFVILDPDWEGLGEQTNKALGIVSAKVAADAHGSQRRILNVDLAGVVTIEFSNRVA
jgi:hypothetical protein